MRGALEEARFIGAFASEIEGEIGFSFHLWIKAGKFYQKVRLSVHFETKFSD